METVSAICWLFFSFAAFVITMTTLIGCVMWLGAWLIKMISGWLNET